MADYRRAKETHPKWYDGNGRLSPIETANGITVEPLPGGKGFRRIGAKEKASPATLQESSATKQNAEVDKLKKENEKISKRNEDLTSLVGDLEKRLRKLEDGK